MTERLVELRAALADDQLTLRAAAVVRRDQIALEQALGEAVTLAFAADAHGARRGDADGSWAAEGLARSNERELLLLAMNEQAFFPSQSTDAPFAARQPG